jgi:hypothetical protein
MSLHSTTCTVTAGNTCKNKHGNVGLTSRDVLQLQALPSTLSCCCCRCCCCCLVRALPLWLAAAPATAAGGPLLEAWLAAAAPRLGWAPALCCRCCLGPASGQAASAQDHLGPQQKYAHGGLTRCAHMHIKRLEKYATSTQSFHWIRQAYIAVMINSTLEPPVQAHLASRASDSRHQVSRDLQWSTTTAHTC